MKRNVCMCLGLIVVLGLVGAMAGCGQQPAPTAVPPTAAPATAAAPTAAPAPTTPPAEPLKIGLLMPGRIDDLGWNQRAYEGLMQLKEKYGAEVTYSELVPIADYERFVRDLAQKGYDLIIGHDFMAMDAIYKVAEEYPDLWFAWAGYPKDAPNVVSYNIYAQDVAYLSGMLAAGMSKTGVVAAMGGFDVPDVVRDVEGFKMGAKAYNPAIKVLVAFTYDWQDPVKGKDTALSLINAGADVIHSDGNPMSLGLFEAAKEKGVYVIGSVGDQHALSPETVLTSGIYGFPMIFDTIVGGLVDGTIKAQFIGPSMKDGGAELAPYYELADVIPQELQDRVEQAKADILSGKLVVPALDVLTEDEPAAEAGEAKKVALIMPGRIDDLGWNQSAYDGLKAVTDKYGVEMSYMELVPTADYERYFREFADRGYDLIIGHDFLAGDALVKVAPDYPDTWFSWTGVGKEAPNLVTQEVWSQEGAYLAGMLAAGMSKTGTVAGVLGYDVPDLIRDAEGFKAGAKALNPDIKVLIAFTYDWQDPVKAKDTASSVISLGADVIQIDGDPKDPGVIEAVEENGIYMIGRTGDWAPRSPDRILTSIIRDYRPAFDQIISGLINGTLTPSRFELTMKDGAVYLAPYGNLEDEIPQELKDKIEQAKQDIMDGKLVVPAVSELSE